MKEQGREITVNVDFVAFKLKQFVVSFLNYCNPMIKNVSQLA